VGALFSPWCYYYHLVPISSLLDKTYAISNTYKDLTLLSVPGNEVMLLNEHGRYFYTNLRYTF